MKVGAPAARRSRRSRTDWRFCQMTRTAYTYTPSMMTMLASRPSAGDSDAAITGPISSVP
ncbi:hypothetical protein D3C86_1559890 [compost metagenome]